MEKKMSRQAASNRKVCEDAEMSGASQIKRQWQQWQHQTKMSRARNAKDKEFTRLPRDHAVDGSYRLSLVLGMDHV
jgi:hypothetical protein